MKRMTLACNWHFCHSNMSLFFVSVFWISPGAIYFLDFFGLSIWLWFIRRNFESKDRQGKGHYYLIIKQLYKNSPLLTHIRHQKSSLSRKWGVQMASPLWTKLNIYVIILSRCSSTFIYLGLEPNTFHKEHDSSLKWVLYIIFSLFLRPIPLPHYQCCL